MKTLRIATAVFAFAVTGLLLLGDSARQCHHDAESATYVASGTCGPSGTVTLSSGKDACDVNLSGDNVGLPDTGQLGSSDDLFGGDFSLIGNVEVPTDGGTLPDGGSTPNAVFRDCTADADGGTLAVTCTATEDDGGTCSDQLALP